MRDTLCIKYLDTPAQYLDIKVIDIKVFDIKVIDIKVFDQLFSLREMPVDLSFSVTQYNDKDFIKIQ